MQDSNPHHEVLFAPVLALPEPLLILDLHKVTSLPCKHGGIGAMEPCRETALNQETSKASTAQLVDAIL
eukprot:3018672-Ditylum_brightwellii.AAC.1